MEVDFDDSKVITRFLPTLLHLASVRVAFLLINEFDYATLTKIYKRIQKGALFESNKIYKDPDSFNYKENLLKCKLDQLVCELELLRRRKSARRERELEFRKRSLEKHERNMIKYRKTDKLMKQFRVQEMFRQKIPPRLRMRVMEAVEGIESGVRRWKNDHLGSWEPLEGECTYYWKSDGTFDGTRTALDLVLNANIDIRKRFRVACTYCFEEIIHALWSELKASGQIGSFLLSDNSMMHFWVRRLQPEVHAVTLRHWTQAFRVYRNSFFMVRIFFSSVFPLLQPEDRKYFFYYMKFAKPDDFRLCMQVMTKEEKRGLVKRPFNLLHCYLQWPLRTVFLEIVEKVWDYLDYIDFLSVLRRLLIIKKCEIIDVSELFEDFWERSPRFWRRLTKKFPVMRKKIKSWLKEIRKKRNTHFKELRRFM